MASVPGGGKVRPELDAKTIAPAVSAAGRHGKRGIAENLKAVTTPARGADRSASHGSSRRHCLKLR